MAPFTLRTMASFFSRKVASRSRMVSRIPPASPAETMFLYNSVKALGCLAKASASVWPLSTSYTTSLVTAASSLFSVCLARISSACTSGRPAMIMVANRRGAKTTTAGGGDPPGGFGFLRFADPHQNQPVLPEVLDHVVPRRQVDAPGLLFAGRRAGGVLEDGHTRTPRRLAA